MSTNFQIFDYSVYSKPTYSWVATGLKAIKLSWGLSPAFAAFEHLAWTLRMIGFKAPWKIVKHIKNELAYVHSVRDDFAPSSSIKSETYTYNHINEYCIKEEAVWFRRKGVEAPWKRIAFPFCTPLKIDVDGANLVVWGSDGFVRFKKVMREKREGNHYIVIEKSQNDNWRSKWFSLPLLHPIVNAIGERHLRLPAQTLGFAVSHRGRFNEYIADAAGQKHYSVIGVSTLYALQDDKRHVKIYDPWMPTWSKTEFPLPATSKQVFFAENFSASASTVMAIGYDRDCKSGEEALKIYTRLPDIDTEGGNPGFSYSYQVDKNNPRLWVLPVDPFWKEHPLYLRNGERVTSAVTISQTGSGMHARELKVAGLNENGKEGFFYKNIDDEGWQFKVEAWREPYKLLEAKRQREPITSPVGDGEGYVSLESGSYPICYEGFGDGSFHTKISLSDSRTTYELDLFARFAFRNFLGFTGKKYDLVIPKKDRGDLRLQQIFSGRISLSVTPSMHNAIMVLKSF